MFLVMIKFCFTERMRYACDHLETLVAITDEGTFEGAARRLHLTPSAVSQRVRALETAAGLVLLRRTNPVTATAAGEPLVRLGRQMQLLADETAAGLGEPDVIDLAVAINADSLNTWFEPVLAAVAERPGLALKLRVEDEAYSHDLLRGGEVLAAVTSEPTPVQGCLVEPLGSLRYVPAASPALVERFKKGHGIDWSAAPVVTFNEQDHLQDQVLARHGLGRPSVVHRIPTAAAFHAAVVCGLGWGLIPERHLAQEVERRNMCRVPGGRAVDVPLYWQRWRLDSDALSGLGEDVKRAAAAVLRPPRPAPSSLRIEEP